MLVDDVVLVFDENQPNEARRDALARLRFAFFSLLSPIRLIILADASSTPARRRSLAFRLGKSFAGIDYQVVRLKSCGLADLADPNESIPYRHVLVNSSRARDIVEALELLLCFEQGVDEAASDSDLLEKLRHTCDMSDALCIVEALDFLANENELFVVGHVARGAGEEGRDRGAIKALAAMRGVGQYTAKLSFAETVRSGSITGYYEETYMVNRELIWPALVAVRQILMT